MRKTIFALLGALATFALPHTASAQEHFTAFETQTAFEDVVTDLSDAIINRGYVVDHHGNIGDMLARTAATVGSDKKLYREAEFFQFCSATVSRAMMEEDVTNIAFCPYVLFAYEAAETPGTVTVGFRRLPQGNGRDQVNALLEEIAQEAAGE